MPIAWRWFVTLALCMGSAAARTVAVPAGGLSVSAGPVEQARLEPAIVRVPAVDRRDVSFTRLSVDQGLSQTRVAHIVQDEQGFIWFGTQHGLNRFDGYKFKVFTNEPGRPGSLGGVFVYSLFKDKVGAVWVGTDQSFDKYDSASETFTHYRIDSRGSVVIHISQDSAGLLWLATSNGLFRLDPVTGNVRHFGHDARDAFSLPSDDVKSSGEDRRGAFWVATSEGLDTFDRSTGQVTFHIPLHEPVREFSFHEDRSGVFWIAYGSGNGLAIFDRKTKTLTRYSFNNEDGGASLTGVFAILEDREGGMWFATMGGGLLRFDRSEQRWIRYRNDPGDAESLAENRVIALFEDREGNIWVGLHAMPPNVFAERPLPFEKFQPGTKQTGSSGENLVNAIYEDHAGQLWMGAGGALNQVNRDNGKFTPHHPAGAALSTEVLAILEDAAGILWVGTLGQGLIRFDRASGTFKAYVHDPADPTSISHNIVTRLLIDHAGTLWVTSWDGLNRFDTASGRSTLYKRNPSGKNESYFEIDEDRQGYLWLGSTSGLYRFDPSTGRFVEFKHDPEKPQTLSNNTVNAVFLDHADTLWVATQNGLDRLNRNTGTFTAYYTKQGLAGNAVSCILEDDRHNLWISTNNGLSQFSPATGRFVNYSASDGLPGGDLTAWGACCKGKSGEMFFGGFSGATAFYPDKVSEMPYVPPVVLTDFRLSGVAVEPGKGSPLTTSITHTGELTLSHEQSIFSVEFSALSFFSPRTNRYRYRLEGLDAGWRDLDSTQRVVSFTTLPAGHYTLRVQGATSRGNWGEPGTTLRINVLPAWWNTAWFRTLCATLLLLSLFAIYLLRLRQVAHQFEIRLDERVGERTRIARELHDSLLQGFQGLMFRLQAVRAMLPARTTEAIKVLDVALERGDQAIAEARSAVHGLRLTGVTDTDLAQALMALGDELMPQGPSTIPALRVLESGKPRALDPIIRDEVYRVAREAMRNAVNHAQARSIEAEVTYGDAQMSLRIRDDGAGIEPDVLADGGRPGHWGLPGMHERTVRFGGRLKVLSRAGAGTEVELTVPASVAYKAPASQGGSRPDSNGGETNHESDS